MAQILDRKALVVVANAVGGNLLPDNAAYTNRFEIRSASSSRVYVVAQRKTDGTMTCGCMGWIRHRNCKHLKAIAPRLVAAGVVVPGVR